jgi:hypothetical protein
MSSAAMAEQLILRRAPIGPNLEDYNVLENGVVVGRRSPGAPGDRKMDGDARPQR